MAAEAKVQLKLPDVFKELNNFVDMNGSNIDKQGIASDTIPSHCTILLTGLIAGWILIS